MVVLLLVVVVVVYYPHVRAEGRRGMPVGAGKGQGQGQGEVEGAATPSTPLCPRSSYASG